MHGIFKPFQVNFHVLLIRLKRIYNFWCSMLIYAPFALCFVYTSWCFYAFSETNLLTRCHSASSLFSAILCSKKVTQEIFSELDKTKAEVPNYLTQRRSPKESRRCTRSQPHLVVARATPRSCHQGVWPLGPPPDIALWYISNVSIIFDAPCLFLHHLSCVLLHFMAFLCDFWN
jgi:hypothetical protein